MKLVVVTPLAVVVDADSVAHVRAEDPTGSFGVLPGHADFLTALTISVVSWRDAAGVERYVAVRGGMLEVRGGTKVSIATHEAIASDDLAQLRPAVLARFQRQVDEESAARTELQRLYLAAIRQICRFLQPTQRGALRASLNSTTGIEP